MPTGSGKSAEKAKTKSELPDNYGSVTTTPFTVTVPTGGKPVTLDLKSK